jgi:predicted nucleotidyltransferase
MLQRPIVPDSLQEPFRSALEAASQNWADLLQDRLLSLVLFGSVARRQARPTSDIDLLVVAEGFPRAFRDRRRPLLEAWERVRSEGGLPSIVWNLVTKSPDEARFHSPLYLDMTEDAVLLLDRDGFFDSVLSAMRTRMRELGSRRVYLSDGSWYWDLKPDYRWGEVVEI